MKKINKIYISDHMKKRPQEQEESWPAVIAMGACLIPGCFAWVVIFGVLAL